MTAQREIAGKQEDNTVKRSSERVKLVAAQVSSFTFAQKWQHIAGGVYLKAFNSQ